MSKIKEVDLKKGSNGQKWKEKKEEKGLVWLCHFYKNSDSYFLDWIDKNKRMKAVFLMVVEKSKQIG